MLIFLGTGGVSDRACLTEVTIHYNKKKTKNYRKTWNSKNTEKNGISYPDVETLGTHFFC